MQEHNNTPNTLSNKVGNKDTSSNSIIPVFEFDKYSIGAEEVISEIEMLLRKSEAPPHSKILRKLLKQFEPLDFKVLANPNNIEKFKINNKHFLILSIENTLLFAKKTNGAYARITI